MTDQSAVNPQPMSYVFVGGVTNTHGGVADLGSTVAEMPTAVSKSTIANPRS